MMPLDDATNALIQNVGLTRLRCNLQYCSLTILAYDYALTFNDEIEYVWKEKFRASTLLYIFCRYGLVANTMYTFSNMGETDSHEVRSFSGMYSVGQIICGIMGIFGRIGILAVWGTRTYAIYGLSRRVMVFLVILASGCIATAIANLALKCHGFSESKALGGALAALMLVFEVSAFALATFKVGLSASKAGSTWLGRKNSLQSLLFRQGLMYIFAVVLLSAATLAMNFHTWTIQTNPGFLQRLLNSVKIPVPCFLTARFILRLRKWDRHRRESNTLSSLPKLGPIDTSLSSIRFRAPTLSSVGSHITPDALRHDLPTLSPPLLPQLGAGVIVPQSPASGVTIFQELGADIGPGPSSSGLPEDLFKEYEWEWDRMDREEFEQRWGKPVEGGQESSRAHCGAMSPTTILESGLGQRLHGKIPSEMERTGGSLSPRTIVSS